MSRFDTRIVGLAVVVVIFVLFVVYFENEAAVEKINISDVDLRLETNKRVYTSDEQILVRILAVSPANISNVTFNMWGIRPSSYPHINQTRILNINEGMNEFVFPARAPVCTSGCGGVYPGPYDINLDLVYGNQTTTAKTVITLTNE